jgi:hypothetical protein
MKGCQNTGATGQTDTLRDDKVDKKPAAKIYRRQKKCNDGIENQGVKKGLEG